MATRMQQRRGTASQWTTANPILNAGEMGWESDTNKFKIGDGTNHWADLDYFIDQSSTVNPSFGTSIVFEGATADSYETTLQVTDPTADRTITLPDANGTVVLTTTLDEMAQDAVNTALTAGTGITKSYDDNGNTITLSVDTSTIQARVADVSDTEIGYLNGVTSAIQTQLDAKSPSAGPTFTGTVVLPSTTSIGDVSSTELGYVNGVTSAIQTQLDNKLALSGGTMTGAIAMGTSKITGLGTPTDATDAATKSYVDAVTEGLHIHEAAIAATTANVNLANALENGDTLDGITLATGNRVLVKNQTTQSENGIYVVQASGQPTRATDFDTASEVDSGDFIFVYSGTVNGGTGWVQTNRPATIGTDAIAFTQFSGAGTYTAGTGLTLTGTTFSINTGTTVDLNTAQTLTNKTIALGSNTFSGTLAEFNTAVTDADFASLAGSETFTNKTLSSAVATTALTLNATAELRLADTDSTHYVGFKAPGTVTTNRVWTLPAADGSAGQTLSTDGSGVLAWSTPAQGAAFSELMLIGA